MTDDAIKAKVEKRMALEKALPPVAVFEAVPGWHALIAVETPLRDTSVPDEQEVHYIYVIPIKRWGLRCPEALLPRVLGDEQLSDTDLSPLPIMMMGMFTGMIEQDPPKLLPLDAREKEPTFFDNGQLQAVYPPSEGSAEQVLEKFQALAKRMNPNSRSWRRREVTLPGDSQ